MLVSPRVLGASAHKELLVSGLLVERFVPLATAFDLVLWHSRHMLCTAAAVVCRMTCSWLLVPYSMHRQDSKLAMAVFFPTLADQAIYGPLETLWVLIHLSCSCLAAS